MKDFFKSLFSDIDNQVSSKRFITVFAFLLLGIAFLLDIFIDVQLKQYIWDGILYIVLMGLGVTTAEKFTNKNKN